MHLNITGRNMEVTEPLKEYAREKINKIEKYLDKITSAHIILTVEKYRHIAEMTIHAHGITLKGVEETGDMYSSIDKTIDKIEIQAKKLKDRIKEKNKRSPSNDTVSVEVDQFPDLPAGHLPRIVKNSSFDPKPMTVEEAAMQFQLRDDLFIVFLDAHTDKVNVLYRRKDGDLGLIETL